MSRWGCTRHAIAHSTLSMSVMSMSSSTAMIHFKPCLTIELAACRANAASPPWGSLLERDGQELRTGTNAFVEVDADEIWHFRRPRLEHGALKAELANTGTLAGWHLTNERLQDRVPAVRDGAHLENELVVLSTDIAPVLTERSFHLQHVGPESSLNGDFGSRRDEHVDGLGLHHLERGAV